MPRGVALAIRDEGRMEINGWSDSLLQASETSFLLFFRGGAAAVGVHLRRDSGGNVCLCLQLTLRSSGLLKAVLFKIKSPYRVDDCRLPNVSADSTALKLEDGSVVFTCPSFFSCNLGEKQ